MTDKYLITALSGGLYTVTGGGENHRCRARGAFRHKRMTPLVGDSVELSRERDGYVISAICDRRTELIRPPMANVDVLFITLAPTDPEPDLLYIDKLISIAIHGGVKPVIVITKSDISPALAEKYAQIYRNARLPVFAVSAYKNEGISEISDFVREENARIFAFAGASGIGKSTLMNALFPGLSLQTGTLADKTSRGRHTTRSVTLYRYASGDRECYIADTPGFSMLDLITFDFFRRDELFATFPEFEGLDARCRWRGCTHTKEDGCAVSAAAKSGQIAQSRYDSYLAMYDDLSKKKDW